MFPTRRVLAASRGERERSFARLERLLLRVARTLATNKGLESTKPQLEVVSNTAEIDSSDCLQTSILLSTLAQAIPIQYINMSRFIGLKSQPYPLDSTGPDASVWDTLSAPYPRYPNKDKLFAQLFPPAVYNATLSPWLPFSFSIAYYLVAHAANHIVKRNGSTDFTKGSSLRARTLRFLILVHNAALAIYSGWTWAMMFPYVVDFFVQGWSAAGFQGVKLALCSMPTNCPHLGKYAYIFYLSKYYEVFDSVILLLKGKKVSNLQSYHHAGAIICMWIAYRYQSQPVWGK